MEPSVAASASGSAAGCVAGLVLAAGEGRRMGGPKALLRLSPGGPTLLEIAVGAVREGGCAEVTVVVGAAAERVGAICDGLGVSVVIEPGWAEGMGASLRAGLARAAGSDAAAVLVTLVDLPDVGADVVARVLAAASPQPAAALARAAYAGVPGHPVLLGRDHWAGVQELAVGDRGARDYLATNAARRVECGDLATGRDLDRPADV